MKKKHIYFNRYINNRNQKNKYVVMQAVKLKKSLKIKTYGFTNKYFANCIFNFFFRTVPKNHFKIYKNLFKKFSKFLSLNKQLFAVYYVFFKQFFYNNYLRRFGKIYSLRIWRKLKKKFRVRVKHQYYTIFQFSVFLVLLVRFLKKVLSGTSVCHADNGPFFTSTFFHLILRNSRSKKVFANKRKLFYYMQKKSSFSLKSQSRSESLNLYKNYKISSFLKHKVLYQTYAEKIKEFIDVYSQLRRKRTRYGRFLLSRIVYVYYFKKYRKFLLFFRFLHFKKFFKNFFLYKFPNFMLHYINIRLTRKNVFINVNNATGKLLYKFSAGHLLALLRISKSNATRARFIKKLTYLLISWARRKRLSYFILQMRGKFWYRKIIAQIIARNLRIILFRDLTSLPHNGIRSKKKPRK